MKRTTLVRGWFSETLTRKTIQSIALTKASIIMIDCDVYSASREALWFCEPLILDQAVVVFDDWGWSVASGDRGQREAFEEFLHAFPDLTAEQLPAYIPQARVFLVTRNLSA